MRAYRWIILKEIATVLDRMRDDGTRRLVSELEKTKRVYVSGVGRSGLVAKAFGQRLMHLGWEVHLADEISAPGIRRGDLLIACSGTGTTELTIYMARKARRIGARCIAMTASANTPLGRLARRTIVIPAGHERNNGDGNVPSRQPARALFEQALFIFLDSIILTLKERLGITARKLRGRHANLE
ncbi:MAG TPA: 6-phospho-3-hexuloisomerase [Planctomycetota bacterium]|nr:6-phospho-3-hexuloisomerase [Planctomycetota bacterium]